MLIILAVLLVSRAALAGDFAKSVAAASGGTLHVDLDWRGTLTVATHDVDAVRVEARAHGWPWDVAFDLVPNGGDVRLIAEAAAADGVAAHLLVLALWPFHHAHVEVRAWVPDRFSIDAHTRGWRVDVGPVGGDVVVAARGGDLRIHEVGGRVDAESAGGGVDVADVRGDVRAVTSGGAVRISRVAGTIAVETSGGGIDVAEAGARVAARTSGGSVAVGFAGAPAGDIETRGGGIEVRVPPAAGAELDAETSGGTVEIAHGLSLDGRTSAHEAVGRLGGGGAVLRLRTSGGSIRVGMP